MRCCGVNGVKGCDVVVMGSCDCVVGVEAEFGGCGVAVLVVAAGPNFLQNHRFGTRWLRVIPEHLFV